MVSIKGSPKGIMIMVEDSTQEAAKGELLEKLAETADFFNEETLEVFLTSSSLTDVEVFSLRPVVVQALANTKIVFIEEVPKMLPKQHSPLDDLSDDEGVTKFIRKTVKTGETLDYANSLIIIGDVQKGASVTAHGNVFVLGTLYGSVTVTKSDSVVVAMKLLPENLEISNVKAILKTSTLKKFLTVPEIAYLAGDEIKIEQYT